MKINVPVVERQLVGARYSYRGENVVYFADNRPNVYAASPVSRPVYDTVLSYRPAFDYDFQIAARLRATVATGILAGILVAGLVTIPAVGVFHIGRDLVRSTIETTRDAAEAAMWTVRYVGAGIVTAAGAIINP